MGLYATLFGPPLKQEIEKTEGITVDREEYLKLARAAGFAGAESAATVLDTKKRTVMLRDWLAENGITVYPAKSVIRYMDSITPKGKEWFWSPVNANAMSRFSGEYYNKPIPAEVLMVMGKIRDSFTDIAFEVTDMRNVEHPDPFLRCRIKGDDEAFIIERWDEPKFRM